METPLKKAGLEMLRVTVLAIIPVLIMSLENGQVDLKYLGIVAGIAALRAVDKFLHEVGKDEDMSQLIKGLTRF